MLIQRFIHCFALNLNRPEFVQNMQMVSVIYCNTVPEYPQKCNIINGNDKHSCHTAPVVKLSRGKPLYQENQKSSILNESQNAICALLSPQPLMSVLDAFHKCSDNGCLYLSLSKWTASFLTIKYVCN